LRVVGYYRPQNTGASDSETAVSAINRYCSEGLHRLVRVLDPGDPPLSDSEQYAALISYLEGLDRGEALVVVPNTLHLATTLDGLVNRLTELERVGGEVRCTDLGLPDPLQNGLELLSFAGRPATQNRQVRESLLSKAARGEVLGRTPYGYVSGIDGTFKVEESEAVLVRRLFDLYSGELISRDSNDVTPSGGLGLRRIAGIFNSEGLRTRTNRPWSPVTLSGMLRNRVYIGSYVRYGMRIAGNHPRIVEREVFNQVQAVIESRSPRRRPRRLTPYLLGNLARCWSCGRGMHGVERQRHWARLDGSTTSRSYRYYVCSSRTADTLNGDLHPSWREKDLDRFTLESLRAEPIDLLRSSFTSIQNRESDNEIQIAEQKFLESFRLVASGRGGISDLVKPLNDLHLSRSAPQSSHKGFTFEDAMESLGSTVPSRIQKAISSFVERVIVQRDHIEVVYHSARP